MAKEKIIVDFQGIFCKGEFYIKEISMFNLKTNEIQSYFIKQKIPKLNYKEWEQYQWLKRHHHRIPISYGDTSIEEIKIPPLAIIYVKGYEKKKIISKMFPNRIINMELYGCSSEIDNDLHLTCSFEKHNSCLNFKYCSLKRVYSFSKFF